MCTNISLISLLNHDLKQRMPRWFSKKYRNELEGTTAAINCVGEERTWKMKLKLDAAKGNFALTSGWKSFSQKHDLQVGDYCKFEMTQLKPVAFIVTITRAKDEPHPDKFQGFSFILGWTSTWKVAQNFDDRLLPKVEACCPPCFQNETMTLSMSFDRNKEKELS